MTKALKQSMPRLKQSVLQRWSDDTLAMRPWGELSSSEQSLLDFWKQCLAQPASEEAVPTFQAWFQSRDPQSAWSVWETWHLLSLMYLCGRRLPDGLFWELWNLGAQAFTEIRDQLDPPDGAEGALDQFLIAGVELRWLALAVFPEVENAARLPKHARRAVTTWHQSFLADDGKPAAEDLSRLPDVWRSLARIADLCVFLKQKPFRKTDDRTFRKLLTTTCRLTGADGRLIVSDAELPWSYLSDIGQRVAAKKPAGLKCLLKTYQTQQNSNKKQSSSRKSTVPNLKPSQQTDAGDWAVLRSKWIDAADVCLVRHDSSTVQIRFEADSLLLFSGDWAVEIESDGQVLSPGDAWEAVCWHSDRDGDYLELQQKLADEITLERQLFLSRKDRFLYAAEVVHAPDERAITVRSSLPLADSLHAEQDRYTREWKLKRKKKAVARLFPLAFDQEIVHKAAGSLSAGADGKQTFAIEKSARGSLYLPLIVDWHPHHLAAPAEWRKLTVTQSQIVCPASVASGYRLRLAEQHLLVYRSLQQPITPRAVLGHHTLNESLIAKFDSDGEVEPLLLVE